jgi:hypothetical protein
MHFQSIQIKEITYKNTEFVGEYEEDKKSFWICIASVKKGNILL